MHGLRQARYRIEEQNALDQRLRVLHFVDGPFPDNAAQPAVVPVLAHLGMDEILIDRRQLFLQDVVEGFDDFRITFHMREFYRKKPSAVSHQL